MSSVNIEVEIGRVDDLVDDQMKEVKVEGISMLLCRLNGKYFATGAKCSHYGAPLVTGVLCNGKVRCPWHGACFNVKTGDIEDHPGLDSIPSFPVSEKKGVLYVTINKDKLSESKIVKPMTKASPSTNSKSIVIIGGGPAGAACCEAIRQEGYQGRVLVISDDSILPYDRPKLSKTLDLTPQQGCFRTEDFYKAHDIEFLLNKSAEKIDVNTKTITMNDKASIKYDKLVITTGSKARKMTMVEGYDLKGVVTLRTLNDANEIAKVAEGKNIVVVGTSFIGVELAASLLSKSKCLTLVGNSAAPFQEILGKEIGQVAKKLLEAKNVNFEFGTSAKQFIGSNGHLNTVLLKNGKSLPADLCITGIGVVPCSDFLKDSGISIDQRGFILVDKTMKTNVMDVYAAGDITSFPLAMSDNQHINIQHFQMAQKQGHIAGLNVAGKITEINSVPFFWTMFCGKSIRYTGYGFGYDDIIITGNVEEFKFAAYYTKGEKVVAVASMGMDPLASQAAELFLSKKHFLKSEVQLDPSGWLNHLKYTHF